MSSDADHQAQIPPHARVVEMFRTITISRLIYAAAKLGLADHLADGAKNAETLAGPLGAHAPSLHRFMRSLTGLGILTEKGEGQFALTPLGDALRSDAPGAARDAVLCIGAPWFQSWEGLVYSIETGKPHFDKVHGARLFDYLEHHPDHATLFNATMVGIHGEEPPAVAAAFDFSPFATIVDVGGGIGAMLAAILNRHRGPRGILYDLPHVVAEAPKLFAAAGVSDRVSIETGSFFEAAPAGDAYILSHILHDWQDDECLRILGHVHEAIDPGGRLLIVEMVIPAGDAPHPSKMFDMTMLAVLGGMERTEAEYRRLLGRAGFDLVGVTPTPTPISVLEAKPSDRQA